MKRVLVTRPAADAAPLVEVLHDLGCEALVEPLLTIVPLAGARIDLDGVQALLFTSANGVRAFATLAAARQLPAVHDLPALAVGDATAAAARSAGFARVESAAGTVEDLAALAARRLDPAAGPLFHGAAVHLAGDLKGRLEDRGFTLRRRVLYRAEPAERLSEAARAAIAGGGIDAVLFFSPRTAETFVRLLDDAGLSTALADCHAVCLSRAVAEALRTIVWRGIVVAARPKQDELVLELRAVLGTQAEVTAETMAASDSPDRDNPGAGPTAADGTAGGRVIAAFGGVRPMANKLAIPVSTVQGWKARGAIPDSRRQQVLAAAQAHGIDLAQSDPVPSAPMLERQAPESQAPESQEAQSQTPQSQMPARADTDSEATAEVPRQSAVTEPAAGLRRHSRATAVGIGALAVALLALVVAVTGVLREPRAPDSEMADRLAAAQSDLATLSARLDGLEGRPAPVPGLDPAALTAVEQRLATLAAGLKVAAGTAAQVLKREGELAAQGGATAQLAETLDRRSARLTRTIEGLRAELAEAAGRLGRLEAAAGAAGTAASQDDVTALAGQLESLASRVDQAGSQAGSQAEARQAALDGLAERVEALAAAAPSVVPGAASNVALVLALLQLRDAVEGSAPYGAELELVRAALGDASPEVGAILVPLEARAAAGLPSLVTLRLGYSETAREIVVAGTGDPDGGVMASVLRHLADVVTVRPLGQVPGAGAEAIAARAEAYLQAGDLAGAVRELTGLDGAAAAAAGPWIGEARARLDAETALKGLVARALSALAPADG